MRELWYIDPRDPLVFLGAQPAGSAEEVTALIPPQSALAGMVRSQLAAQEHVVDAARARELLEVGIRGPLLHHAPLGGEAAFYAPAPADCQVEPDAASSLVRAPLVSLPSSGGVSWPRGTPRLNAAFHLAPLSDKPGVVGLKRRPPKDWGALWRLDGLVAWGLGADLPGSPALPAPARAKASHEARTHVVIDDDTYAAEAGGLFRSPGVRFPDDLDVAVEVELPDAWATHPAPPSTTTLGGESRLAFLRRQPGSRFPDFATFEGTYRELLQKRFTSSERSLLRLQLLTPAALHADPPGSASAAGWLPWWVDAGTGEGVHPGLPDVILTLRAVCIPGGNQTISGWNLQRVNNQRATGAAPHGSEGGPRGVRRLVPAGCLYAFEVRRRDGAAVDAAVFLEACRRLWLAPLSPASGASAPDDRFRAPAERDGYGLVLPGLSEVSP